MLQMYTNLGQHFSVMESVFGCSDMIKCKEFRKLTSFWRQKVNQREFRPYLKLKLYDSLSFESH